MVWWRLRRGRGDGRGGGRGAAAAVPTPTAFVLFFLGPPASFDETCSQCTAIVFAMHGYRVRNAPLSLPGNDMYMCACMWFPVASGRSLFCVLPVPWPITTACLCVCRHGGGQGGKKGGGRGVNERGNEGKSERECVCMCVCARVNG